MTEHEQGSAEWLDDRSRCITASRMSDLVWEPGKFKSGARKGQQKPPPDARANYINQIVAEILTNSSIEQITARTLEYGKEMEPHAMAAYEARTGRMVETCGFRRHPDYPFIGASPDFLCDDDGGGEIKCPMSIVVHAKTLREGLPKEHIEQIQGGLWVTGRRWWDFVSYNPKFNDGLDLYIERVHRDEEFISRLEKYCLSAWDEVQQIITTLRHPI